LSLVRLHGVCRYQDALEGQGLQQRPEVGDLVGLPVLGDLVLGDDQAGTWVTAASRCTFFFPPALASLRSLPSTAAAGRAGTCPGSPVTAASSQGWAGCARNQPSALSSRKLPAAGGFRFLFLRLTSFFPLFFRAVRGAGGRDRGIERGGGHARGQRGLELVGIQQPREPVQHRGGRRDPQPGPRADAAAVPGQYLLVPSRCGLRDRQRPAVPRRHARDQHRYQRGQRMPLSPPVPAVRQAPVQRLPHGHRIGCRPGRKVAADAVGKP